MTSLHIYFYSLTLHHHQETKNSTKGEQKNEKNNVRGKNEIKSCVQS